MEEQFCVWLLGLISTSCKLEKNAADSIYELLEMQLCCPFFQLCTWNSTVKDGDLPEATRWQCFRTVLRFLGQFYLSASHYYKSNRNRPPLKDQIPNAHLLSSKRMAKNTVMVDDQYSLVAVCFLDFLKSCMFCY